MTSPGRKGLPTIEPGCVERMVEIGVDEVGLFDDAVSAGVVFPAGPHPTTRITDIINAMNISSGPIFIVVSSCLLAALCKYT
jgi:predicted metal-binding protein